MRDRNSEDEHTVTSAFKFVYITSGILNFYMAMQTSATRGQISPMRIRMIETLWCWVKTQISEWIRLNMFGFTQLPVRRLKTYSELYW